MKKYKNILITIFLTVILFTCTSCGIKNKLSLTEEYKNTQ